MGKGRGSSRLGAGSYGGTSGGDKVTAKTYALFHGSPNADIEEFDIDKAGTNTSTGEKFLFFTDSKQQADDFSYERLETSSMFMDERGKKGRVYEVDVTMQKPLDLTNPSKRDIQNIIKLSDGELSESEVKKFSGGNNQLLKSYIDLDRITEYGYDGFIAKMNRNGDKEYAVVSSKQVKIKR